MSKEELEATLDGFTFGDVRRLEVAMAQWIGLMIINVITYLQLCLIGNQLLSPMPMLALFGIQIVTSIVLVLIYTTVYHKLYAPHNMLLVFGCKDSVGLKFKMDSRKDKYNITGLISADEGYDAIVKNQPIIMKWKSSRATILKKTSKISTKKKIVMVIPQPCVL